MRVSAAILLALSFASLPLHSAVAQQRPAPDSLVTNFLRDPAGSPVGPIDLYNGCPNLQAWQNRDIEYLMRIPLTDPQRHSLLIQWGWAMKDCHEPRLERWFLGQLDEAIDRGDHPVQLMVYWDALRRADSPGIRSHLWNLMLDERRPPHMRSMGGAVLFERMGPEEATREYLRAFETGRMPREFADAQAGVLMRRAADRLVNGVAERIRSRAQLMDQPAFDAVAQFAPEYARPEALQGLARAVEANLDAPGVSDRRRGILRAYMRHLTRDRTREG